MPNTQYDAREHLLHEFAVSDSYKHRTTYKYKKQNVNQKMSTEPRYWIIHFQHNGEKCAESISSWFIRFSLLIIVGFYFLLFVLVI